MRNLWLFVALILLCSPARADQISDQVGKLKVQDSRLEKPVTIWRPAICIGDLLEQASEQTGAPVYAEDLDGAAGEIVGVYVKNQPLGDLMESLASLLSERGAVWEWRKTTGRNGKVAFKLYSAAQKSRPRLRNEISESYLGILERALSGNTAGDASANRLRKDAADSIKILKGFTTREQRRDLMMTGNEFRIPRSKLPLNVPFSFDEEESLEFSRYRGSGIVPSLGLSTENEPLILKEDTALLTHILSPAIRRWRLVDDIERKQKLENPVENQKSLTKPDDADSLDRFARITGIPVLAHGANLSAPQIDQEIELTEKDWCQRDNDRDIDVLTSQKRRGKFLLIRRWSTILTGDSKFTIPWSELRELRRKIALGNTPSQAVRALFQMASRRTSADLLLFSLLTSRLIPFECLSLYTSQNESISAGYSGGSLVLAMIGDISQKESDFQRALAGGIDLMSASPDLRESLQAFVGSSRHLNGTEMHSGKLRLEIDPLATGDLLSDAVSSIQSRFQRVFRLGLNRESRTIEVKVWLQINDLPEALVRRIQFSPDKFTFKPPP